MKNWTPLRRYRFRRTLLIAAVSATIATASIKSDIPDDLVCDTVAQVCLIPPYSNDVLVGEGPTVKVGASQLPPIVRCINKYETGGRWNAYNPPYYGAAQWQQTTWDSAGGKQWDGVRPDRAPSREQIKRTLRLIEIRRSKGLSPLAKWGHAVRHNCKKYL